VVFIADNVNLVKNILFIYFIFFNIHIYYNMDLKEYKRRIAEKLNNNDYDMVNTNKRFVDYVPKMKKVVTRKSKPIPIPLPSENSNDINDDSPIDIAGGKLHFLKHMKKLGNSIKNEAVNIGSSALNDVKKDITNEVKSNVKGALNDAKIMAYQAGRDMIASAPVAEEAAPLLLAAGIQKKPRQQSEKQKNRNALIKKLMSKHGCSLTEASKYIKDHNLSY
jgi:hypothetical protein